MVYIVHSMAAVSGQDVGLIGNLAKYMFLSLFGYGFSMFLFFLFGTLVLSRLIDVSIWGLFKMTLPANESEVKQIKSKQEIITLPTAYKKIPVVNYEQVQNDKLFTTGKMQIPFGVDESGNVVYEDITRLPHLLVAGATNGGKSNFIHTLIASLLQKNNHEELKFIFIDLKRVELTLYEGIPHLLHPVVTEENKVIGILNELVDEMERRYSDMSKGRYRNITEYNANNDFKMSNIVLLIDEYADINDGCKQAIPIVARLLRKSRGCGICIIIATQRPSVKVITGDIKCNITARVAFPVQSGFDSETILDQRGAEKLLECGDMLLKTIKDRDLKHLRSFYMPMEIIDSVIDKVKKDKPEMSELWSEIDSFNLFSQEKPKQMFKDEKTETVLLEAIKKGSISQSWIVAKFSVGFGRATKILCEIEALPGVVAEFAPGGKPRAILISEEDWMEIKKGLTK